MSDALTAGPAAKGRKRLGRNRSLGSHSQTAVMKKNYPLRFLVPAGAVLLVFFFVPTVLNFIYAFTDWSAFKTTISFNGFDNFMSLFKNGILLRDLRTTMVFALCVAFFQNTFGLILAVFLEKTRLKTASPGCSSSFLCSCRPSLWDMSGRPSFRPMAPWTRY